MLRYRSEIVFREIFIYMGQVRKSDHCRAISEIVMIEFLCFEEIGGLL
jgi:hypothetical protein